MYKKAKRKWPHNLVNQKTSMTYLWNWRFELSSFGKNESHIKRCGARWRRWLMISIYYEIGFTVRTGTVKNQLAFIIPFSQGGNNRGVVSKYAKEYFKKSADIEGGQLQVIWAQADSKRSELLQYLRSVILWQELPVLMSCIIYCFAAIQ